MGLVVGGSVLGRVTVYCVQPFWRAGPTKLAAGELRQFNDAGEAERVGRASARRHAGALVYSVAGHPDFEQWDPPKLLFKLGEVPDIAF